MQESAPAREKVPAGHAVPAEVVDGHWLPALQTVQAVAPVAVVYRPALHVGQSPAADAPNVSA